MISFTVPGLPVPQGSMTAFIKGGRPVITHKRSDALKDYRARCAMAAQAAGASCSSEPISLRAVFYMLRPKSHFGTGRNAHTLKPSAPDYCATTPDIDKILRALLDALTGVCFADDKQVVRAHVVQRYADANHAPGTEVQVSEIVSNQVRAEEEVSA